MADIKVKNPVVIVGTKAQVESTTMGENDFGIATDVEFYNKEETDALLSAISETLNNKADLDLHNLNNEGKKSVTTTGMVMAFAGTTAPTGWLKCDGSAISRTTYADLFEAIGTKYGTGDGSTTFNLPTQSVIPLGNTAPVHNGDGTTRATLLFYTHTGELINSGTTKYRNISIDDGSAVYASTTPVSSGTAAPARIDLRADLTRATGATTIACIKY
ncbi:MAG: phage tail protein [Alphaproteobacteria bacterium]